MWQIDLLATTANSQNKSFGGFEDDRFGYLANVAAKLSSGLGGSMGRLVKGMRSDIEVVQSGPLGEGNHLACW